MSHRPPLRSWASCVVSERLSRRLMSALSASNHSRKFSETSGLYAGKRPCDNRSRSSAVDVRPSRSSHQSTDTSSGGRPIWSASASMGAPTCRSRYSSWRKLCAACPFCDSGNKSSWTTFRERAWPRRDVRYRSRANSRPDEGPIRRSPTSIATMPRVRTDTCARTTAQGSFGVRLTSLRHMPVTPILRPNASGRQMAAPLLRVRS